MYVYNRNPTDHCSFGSFQNKLPRWFLKLPLPGLMFLFWALMVLMAPAVAIKPGKSSSFRGYSFVFGGDKYLETAWATLQGSNTGWQIPPCSCINPIGKENFNEFVSPRLSPSSFYSRFASSLAFESFFVNSTSHQKKTGPELWTSGKMCFTGQGSTFPTTKFCLPHFVGKLPKTTQSERKVSKSESQRA